MWLDTLIYNAHSHENKQENMKDSKQKSNKNKRCINGKLKSEIKSRFASKHKKL